MSSTPFTCDLRLAPAPLRQPWQWCVGSGHATLALRADWQAHLAQARRDLGFRHVRFHGLLDDDMGTLVVENDKPLDSFFNTDRIFDFLLSIGMKPIVELSFMPRGLSSGNDIVFHYQGNITPPRDLGAWAAYFDLYDSAAQALKSVDSRLLVGGPATAENEWVGDFVGHCAAKRVPADFVSTHYCPTDAFGKVDSDTVTQLEHAPRDVMHTRALEARAAVADRPLYYTEWSISSNPRDPQHDGPFAATLATRIVMSVDDIVDGYSGWTFSDIFEENYFPSVPFHGGFGLMNLYGIPKPIYRAFELVRALGDQRFVVEGSGIDITVAPQSVNLIRIEWDCAS